MADVGDTVTVNYVGVRSVDGVEFDNSYDRGQTFPLVLGTGSVIRGWDQGLVGAQAGARIQLDIPPDLAYGDQAAGESSGPARRLTFVVDVVSVEQRPEVTAPPMADPADCPATDGSEPQQQEFAEMQPFCIDVTKTYTAEIVTNFGPITVELLPDAAPQNVNNFVTLARYKYFDDTECHRVITDFVVQCGDPQGDGYGGPGYTIPDELPLPGEYRAGSIAMANTGQPNSAGQPVLHHHRPERCRAAAAVQPVRGRDRRDRDRRRAQRAPEPRRRQRRPTARDDHHRVGDDHRVLSPVTVGSDPGPLRRRLSGRCGRTHHRGRHRRVRRRRSSRPVRRAG